MAVILVRYSEIGLKSVPVRTRFENRLKENMLSMLAADGLEAAVSKGEARFYVESSDVDRATESLKRVFGIASLSIAETAPADLESICAAAASYSLGRLSPGQSFAVKARREGNRHPFTSMDVGKEAGSAIFLANEDKGVKVDLTRPDKVFYVEVRNNRTYIFDGYVKCHGGLPLGTQGRVAAEVSDGRGALSAWLMMKRGCKVIVRGEYGRDMLIRYDPDLKLTDAGDPRRIHGYVLGTSLAGLENVDVSAYGLPVYFPTVGMTDAEVEDLLKVVSRV